MPELDPGHAMRASDATPELGPALITGGHGFAGRHLSTLLGDCVAPVKDELDCLDPGDMRAAVRDAAPAAIFHLAAMANPQRSIDDPHNALIGNLTMTQNVLEAARHEAPQATVLLISSGQVYGPPEAIPVAEDAPIAPANPYAVSKAAGELLGAQYAATHGMRVISARPFNHAGPGQSQEYAVSDFAHQVAAGEAAGAGSVRIETGDTSIARDFTDVRDVVRAYRLLAEEAEPGTYNVCSGRPTRLTEVIELLAARAQVEVEHAVDPSRLRAGEPHEIVGSNELLTRTTGWVPEISLETTVADTLGHWRDRLA